MSGTVNNHHDVEVGLDDNSQTFSCLPFGILRPRALAQEQHELSSEHGTENDPSRSLGESHQEHKDFDDGANDLWSLFGKEAKSHDEVQIQALKEDMDGVLIFAGLFSSVLSAFVFPRIQDLKENPADQSVYYQQQSVQILA